MNEGAQGRPEDSSEPTLDELFARLDDLTARLGDSLRDRADEREIVAEDGPVTARPSSRPAGRRPVFGRTRRPRSVHTRPGRRAGGVVTAVVGVMSTLVTVAGVSSIGSTAAFANAANPQPTTTGSATVDPKTGAVTINLQGTWLWPGQDCESRIGTGYAIDWWGVSTSKTVTSTFALTGTSVTGYNSVTEASISPAGSIEYNPGHGVTPTYFHVGTYYSGEDINDQNGNPGGADSLLPSGATCTDVTNIPGQTGGNSSGSQGPWAASATYPSVSDVPPQLCVIMYDEHNSELAGYGPNTNGQFPNQTFTNNNGQVENDWSPSGDGDNSIQTNVFDPAQGGGYCLSTSFVPSVSIAKSGPATGLPNGDGTYVMKATNNGTATATSVIINDDIPTGETFVAPGTGSTTTTGCALTATPDTGYAQTVQCPVGSVAAGNSASVNIEVAYGSGTSGQTLTDCATAINGSTTSSQACASTVINAPILSIVKTGPASTVPGANAAYTMTVTNSGTAAAPNTVITDDLPTGETFDAAASTAGCALAATPDSGYAQTVLCPVGTVAANGGTATVTIEVTYATNPPGDLNDCATADSGSSNAGKSCVDTDTPTIAGYVYECNANSATTTLVPGATVLAQVKGQTTTPIPPSGATNPLAPTAAAANTYTESATVPTGWALVASCPGGLSGENATLPPTVTSGGSAATETVGVPSGGDGVGIFYAVPVTQTISGDIYQCVNGSPTTTLASGGNISVTSGPQTVSASGNPLPATGVAAGTYGTTATAPPGDEFVSCGGSAFIANPPTTAGDTVNVPVGGNGNAVYYVIPIPAPAITLLKTASINSFSAAGTPVTYTYAVKNTGNVTLDPVTVTDPMVGLSQISCPDTSLAVGASESCTATYSTTAADLSAGHVDNTGTATGTPPSGPNVTAISKVSIPGSNLVVVKTSNPTSGTSVDPGGPVTYNLSFSNATGTTAATVNWTDSLTDVLDDATVTAAPALASGSGLTVSGIANGAFTITGTLAPGASATVTYSVMVDKPDPGNHVLNNYVVPTGTTPPTSCVAGSATCTSNPVADISLVKSASIASYSAAGTPVTYSYLVKNTGQVTLNPVVVSDPMAGLSAINCPTTSLSVGESEICTATYSTTAADLTAGHVDNTGTATGTPPSGPNVTATSKVSIPGSNLVVVKSSSPTSGTSVDPGGPVTYNLSFSNATGTTAATVNWTDSLTDVLDDATVTATPTVASGSGLTVSGIANGAFTITGTLAPGASATVTYSVMVDKPDPGNHVLNNYVVPSGTTPPPTCVISSTTCTSNPVADISLVKAASISSYPAAGTPVVYSYLVTNTGQVVLDPVTVTDPMVGLSKISCPDTSLAVGASETCTADYSTTAADVTAGHVDNTGTATGTPPSGPNVTATSKVSIPGSDLVVVKTSTPTSGTSVDPGSTVSYTLSFSNTHGTTAAAVAYSDYVSDVLDDATITAAPAVTSGSGLTVGPMQAVGPPTVAWFTITGSLAPGASATVSYTVQVDKPDPGNHVLNNYVVPTGTNPPNGCVTGSPLCTSNPVADISLVKSASITSYSAAGTPVVYSYLVTNTGQVVLDPVTVTDPMVGLSKINCPDTSLAVGASETCTADYSTTAADLTAGHVDNTGTATGTPPSGPPVTSTSKVSIPGSNLVVAKTSNPTSGTSVDPGAPVTYTLSFSNTGGTTAAAVNWTDSLTDVLDDATVTTAPALASGSGLTVGAISNGAFTITGTLAPGASATVTYSVMVDKPDPGNHVLTNYVVPTGTPPPVVCANSTTCTVNPVADIKLVKSASITSYPAAGTPITYSYLVTNTGQVALNPVTVTDPMTGLSTINCPATSLAIGASETCTADYTTTAADVTAGHVDNTGTATGTPPVGTPVTSTSKVSVPGSNLVVTKVSSPASGTNVELGDPVTYTLSFANTNGQAAATVNYTDALTDVLDDATVTTAPALATGSGLTVSAISSGQFTVTGTLAPGATATVTYAVQVNDPDTGNHVLDNYVVPTGTTPPTTCAIGSTTCTTNPVADILLVKSANTASYTNAGTLVTYSYTVTNTGAVKLDPVTVTDPMTGLSAISCPATSLDAGETMICTATYTVTTSDVGVGDHIDNTGTATGTPPAGPPVKSKSSVTIPWKGTSIATTTTVAPTIPTTPATAAPSHLVFTGANALATALIGLVTIGFGFGLVMLTRVRRRRLS